MQQVAWSVHFVGAAYLMPAAQDMFLKHNPQFA